MQDCSINVLGTEYQIRFVEKLPERYQEFEETADGLCNSCNREIYVKNAKERDMTEEGHERAVKRALRHEIYHAFLFESGLSSNTYGTYGAWAEFEEMIDWNAIQSPKIFKVFKELNLL